MRILHTADWHLGRQLHGRDLGPAQEAFIDHLVDVVGTERVDTVLVSGDVHDRALPGLPALTLFSEALTRLRDAGATVVVISGNHDAALRLGDKAGLLDSRIQIRTDPARVADPVVLGDRHGPVAVYAIPYLEPAAVGASLPGVDGDEPGAHQRVVGRAMRAIRVDAAARGTRSVVLAHAWVAGGEPTDSERDLGVGGVARVSRSMFDGIDYTALGHLHGPQVLAPGLRYSGSPLPYSFSEAGHVKGSWLVELDATGLRSVRAVPAPVWRRLSVLRGPLEELLHSRRFDGQQDDVVSAVVTDARRPVDAMSRLQRRFPFAVTLAFVPDGPVREVSTYAAKTRGRSDVDISLAFLDHVRGDADPRDAQVFGAAFGAVRLAASDIAPCPAGLVA